MPEIIGSDIPLKASPDQFIKIDLDYYGRHLTFRPILSTRGLVHIPLLRQRHELQLYRLRARIVHVLVLFTPHVTDHRRNSVDLVPNGARTFPWRR